MAPEGGDEPPRVDNTLDPIRAAIRMVADGSARRVTVHPPALRQILPAARQIARAAGVSIEAVGLEDPPEIASEMIVTADDARPGA